MLQLGHTISTCQIVKMLVHNGKGAQSTVLVVVVACSVIVCVEHNLWTDRTSSVEMDVTNEIITVTQSRKIDSNTILCSHYPFKYHTNSMKERQGGNRVESKRAMILRWDVV
eukprot:scaffold23287_cov175-Amphora_coffeaeformis.AAC.12